MKKGKVTWIPWIALFAPLLLLSGCKSVEDGFDFAPIAVVDNLDCGKARLVGTLTAGDAARDVSLRVPYTKSNGQDFAGETIPSTGVTGLTAILARLKFQEGPDSLTYIITGTPATAGTARFRLGAGRDSCDLNLVVGSRAGTLQNMNCLNANNSGTLIAGLAANGVSSTIPYTDGNGGPHGGQTVTSTGVLGLTATLQAGNLNIGNGTLTYNITGNPAGSGNAQFALNIAGGTCMLTRSVVGGLISTISCSTASNNGTLVSGTAASGVNSIISYTGGNGGLHGGQSVTSTGVSGLTATLAAGNFANGNGNLTYTISGTPSSSGLARFSINIGNRTCTLERMVSAPFICGNSIMDIEGNIYNTVQIGNQCWMRENLRVGKFNDGITIPEIITNAAWSNLFTINISGGPYGWCYYNNDVNFNTQYGKLYNGGAMRSGKLCPQGWREPTLADFTNLIQHLGGANDALPKLKSTSGWNQSTGTNNESGFTALPGGFRNKDGFKVAGDSAYFATSDRYWLVIGLQLLFAGQFITNDYQTLGASCRCIKN
jgi:uncharacterized protein (TIGR02145 family)